MPTPTLILTKLSSAIAAVALLSACGGGGSSEPSTGTLSLGITDAPIEDVFKVVVQFTGVSVKPASGEAIDFDFAEPRDIDLLSLTDGVAEDLLSGEQLEAGRYNWIRLNVNADDDGVTDSYVTTDDLGTTEELVVTSQRGLQLSSGFVITAGQGTNFIIDWDLKKGLVAPATERQAWKLRPSLRITDLATFGEISGTVANGLIEDAACSTAPDSDDGNSVYVFEKADATPEDIWIADEEAETQPSDARLAMNPIATARVKMNDNGGYDYIVNYLAPGDYTVAFTCQALDDEPNAENDIVFSAVASATVVDDQVTDRPLPATESGS